MDTQAYDTMCAEFDRVADEYEKASKRMLAVARDPVATAEEFKWTSDLVARLADKMKEIRTAMSIVKRIQNIPDSRCPDRPMPEPPEMESLEPVKAATARAPLPDSP